MVVGVAQAGAEASAEANPVAGKPRKVAVALERAGPYRKPTQVDGSSRPRCARETTLRNSAK